SHSQSPSQDSARNRPTAVASEVNAGHTRSQKIVQRARLSVASSRARVASGDRGGGGGGGPALGKVASVTRIPSFSGPAYRHHTYQQGNMRAGSRHQNPLAIMLCKFKARAAGGRAAAVPRSHGNPYSPVQTSTSEFNERSEQQSSPAPEYSGPLWLRVQPQRVEQATD